jgi:hypothetical protein
MTSSRSAASPDQDHVVSGPPNVLIEHARALTENEASQFIHSLGEDVIVPNRFSDSGHIVSEEKVMPLSEHRPQPLARLEYL